MKKLRVKEHSTSFYLEFEILAKLDAIAKFYNVSRSQVVQSMLDFKRKGGNNEAWNLSQKIYKPKKAKEIHPLKNRKRLYKKAIKKRAFKQECLFNPMYSKWYRDDTQHEFISQ